MIDKPVAAVCRLCASSSMRSFVDLRTSPFANSFISLASLNESEVFYPLHVFVCEECLLVQLAEFKAPASIFNEYLYFSSFSTSWLLHARTYVAAQIKRFRLGYDSLVVEIASNDGYLLQYAAAQGLAVLGVEPAANVAAVAVERGIASDVSFFGAATATRLKDEGYAPDLMVANNVLAHVPNLHDFLEGFRILLSADGVITFEFPHLLRLIDQRQFDTIYHEHFSYFSFHVVVKMLAEHGLSVFDVEELSTHGGSLRVFACHSECLAHTCMDSVAQLIEEERTFGLMTLATYSEFSDAVAKIKFDLVEFLISARRNGKSVAAYGAPAKGNTLLNFCGVGQELLQFTVDANPHKQDLFLPGVRLPVRHPNAIDQARPDYLLILPWNLKSEIMAQMKHIEDWGGRFVVPIPELAIL